MKVILNVFFLTLICSSLNGQITVFETGFDNGIPSSMTLIDNDQNTPNVAVSEYNAPWICIGDPANPSDSVAASTSWFDPADTADRWIITPSLALGSYGNSIIWNAKSQDASFPDDYYVLVSTTDTNLSSFTDTIGYIQQEDFEWIERSVNLSELGYDDQSIYVAFVLRTFDGYKLYLDDILVSKEDDASIDEENEGEVFIFPNPCQDMLHIQSQLLIDQMTLFDLSGKIVLESKTSPINLEKVEQGTYMLRINSGSNVMNKPVYIQ